MTKAEKKNRKPNDTAQSRLFIEKAREIGADEEKSMADELMGRLAKTPPDHQSKAKRMRKAGKP
jgi:hypothetical protein